MDRSIARPVQLGAVLAILMIVLAACGATGSGDAAIGEDLMGGDQAAASAAAGGGDEAGAPAEDREDGAPPLAAPIEQRIVKTGEITLEVPRVGEAIGRVRALTTELGGYVGGSQAGTLDDSASLTIRIPAARFDDALAALHEMEGEVTAEATREEDVTGSVVDLEARIRNLEASETQYRALLDRATDIEDILVIQSRLDEVRGQIEQLQAQLDQLSELASLATLVVTVVPVAAPVEEAASAWDPGAIFDSAVAALVGLGQAIAAAGIWLVILGLPLAVVLGIIVWIGLRLAPAARRRATPQEHPAGAGE